MEFYRTVEHPLVTKLEPEIVTFIRATFNFHWAQRPRDMTHTETAHLQHPGVALNYLRRELKVEREYMGQLLLMTPNNYTQLELRGSPVNLPMMHQLRDFCTARGMPRLAIYFETYIGIKKRKNNNGYGERRTVIPIER